MTWTVILYDGFRYSREVFQGSHDSARAIIEASKRFAEFWPPPVGQIWPPIKNVVVVIPGDHPVYTSPK